MAWFDKYTHSFTSLEGNTITYKVQQDTGSAPTVEDLDLTSNSYNIKFDFSDSDGLQLGRGLLGMAITIEIIGNTVGNAITSNPNNYRLVITSSGLSNNIFVGYPEPKINNFFIPSYNDLYKITFYETLTAFASYESEAMGTTIDATSNVNQTADQVPIPDVLGEFIYEDLSGQSSDVFIAHPWESVNAVVDLNPQMRSMHIDIEHYDTVGESLSQVCKAFFCRMGYSFTEGKAMILEVIAGAESSSISGYNTVKNGSSGSRTASADTVNHNPDVADDIIVTGDFTSDNPIFPKFLDHETNDLSGLPLLGITPNPTSANYYDPGERIEVDFDPTTRSASAADGLTVLGTAGATQPCGNVDHVDDGSSGSAYGLGVAINRRMGNHWLFNAGNKGGRISIDGLLDPMLPVIYDVQETYIFVDGTINLYEEIMEDCLLIQTRENLVT